MRKSKNSKKILSNIIELQRFLELVNYYKEFIEELTS